MEKITAHQPALWHTASDSGERRGKRRPRATGNPHNTSRSFPSAGFRRGSNRRGSAEAFCRDDALEGGYAAESGDALAREPRGTAADEGFFLSLGDRGERVGRLLGRGTRFRVREDSLCGREDTRSARNDPPFKREDLSQAWDDPHEELDDPQPAWEDSQEQWDGSHSAREHAPLAWEDATGGGDGGDLCAVERNGDEAKRRAATSGADGRVPPSHGIAAEHPCSSAALTLVPPYPS